LGHHPFFVEQQKSTYQRVESRKSEKLFKAWSEAEDNPRYDNNYRQIFIHLEEAMKEDMKKDRSDKHSRSERGWTPPPKGYADGFEEEES
jgi:CPA2 family monovalent cation:H+ antiporter-2/glutathione-regulated potassium-efflux system ancillary protein KefC